MDIPKDIWIYILTYLDLKTLTIFMRSSKYCNILANDNYLWKTFCNSLYFYNELEYKKENYKQNYKICLSKNIKTIILKNYKVILKGNNQCYYSYVNENENKLIIYDSYKKDKSLTIINIFYENYFDDILFLSINNKIYWSNDIDNLKLYNNIQILYEIISYEIDISLEKNDIIKNFIYIRVYHFIIVKNIITGINKLFIWKWTNEITILLLSINFDIIDIEYVYLNEHCIYNVIYLDKCNNKQYMKINYEFKI